MGKHRTFKCGDVVESLEIVEYLGLLSYGGKPASYYRCKCLKCGKIVDIPLKNLGKAQKDCGCWRSSPRSGIKIGDVFGRLTVIGIQRSEKKAGYDCVCKCSCPKGTIMTARTDSLRCGDVQSCGCLHDELAIEHISKAYDRIFVNNTAITKTYYDLPLQRNNKSGERGVYWHKGVKKWRVSMKYQKQAYSFGYYSDLEEAKAVAREARKHIVSDFVSWYSQLYPEEWEKIKSKGAHAT